MAIRVMSHPAMPPATTVWTAVRPGWGATKDVPAEEGTLPLAYDWKPTIKPNAEGVKTAKPSKLLQIASTTLAVCRTKWTCFMTTSLAMGNDSV
jgi:hypothetical protein